MKENKSSKQKCLPLSLLEFLLVITFVGIIVTLSIGTFLARRIMEGQVGVEATGEIQFGAYNDAKEMVLVYDDLIRLDKIELDGSINWFEVAVTSRDVLGHDISNWPVIRVRNATKHIWKTETGFRAGTDRDAEPRRR